MTTTLGISPKAVFAFLYPLLATFGGTVAVWITSGSFNSAEVKVALAGLVTSALAALGAYLGDPGAVAHVTDARLIPADKGDRQAVKKRV